MAVGLYISVPFCRSKCSYCNFASDVFSRAVFDRYVDRVCADIENSPPTAAVVGGDFDRQVDSIYLGGGTPTILESHQLERIFVTIRQNFCLQSDTEITVECAPGTLTPPILEALLRCGVNRVSLGVQSFVDQEAAAVGRLHRRTTVMGDITRLRQAGIANLNLDLIAGLPHQTRESWNYSLAETIATGVPHASVYMLEVDEDSRLGSELIAGGAKYHAHFVPDDELTTDLYLEACRQLNSEGISHYEISNFARSGFESRHNLKYWTRQPYLGFGMDAHSMLRSSVEDAVRFARPDALETYMAGTPLPRTVVTRKNALEETFFLGLRLVRGVDLRLVAAQFGDEAVSCVAPLLQELIDLGLLTRDGDMVRLTDRGRLLSNEVFQRFLAAPIEV